ncbi:hypothetical protein BX666DRAFT_1959252 [Dichotomocladium elegans]|nr:hypothetical protein BX666DRAFT_1959252 [Dichotomocladium elegans]
MESYWSSPYSTMRSSSSTLPLTKENLSLVEEYSEEAEPSISLLARYYNELPLPAPPMSSRRERRVSSTTSTHSDMVMASPRLSPFPYHNDSLFLPMAEHHHHGSISSRCQSPVGSMASQRRASAAERRPSPLSVIPPRRQASAPPMERIRRPTMPASSSSMMTTTTKLKAALPQSVMHWFSKVLGVKKKKATSMPAKRLAENSPVWYTQFSANPPPPAGLVMVAA